MPLVCQSHLLLCSHYFAVRPSARLAACLYAPGDLLRHFSLPQFVRANACASASQPVAAQASPAQSPAILQQLAAEERSGSTARAAAQLTWAPEFVRASAQVDERLHEVPEAAHFEEAGAEARPKVKLV